MKRIAIMTITFFALFLSACNSYDVSHSFSELELSSAQSSEAELSPSVPLGHERVYQYLYYTFEEFLSEFTTDVVVVQYIGQKPFRNTLTEFEFEVREKVVGDAPNKIFVYAGRVDAHVLGGARSISFSVGDLTFNPGTEYLLPLTKINSPYAFTHEDGYEFNHNIVIDLSDPSNSIMYSEPFFQHSEGLALNEDGSIDITTDESNDVSINNLSDALTNIFKNRKHSRHIAKNSVKMEIISYVEESINYPQKPRDVIISSAISDIINGSPYVLVVDINEPLRLSGEIFSDWMATDIYYSTAIQVLKGDMEVENKFLTTYFADTVQTGDRYIIAAEPIAEGENWYHFTSRNSLFRMDQLDEIMSILENPSERRNRQ